jgi:hypothetical protein
MTPTTITKDYLLLSHESTSLPKLTPNYDIELHKNHDNHLLNEDHTWLIHNHSITTLEDVVEPKYLNQKDKTSPLIKNQSNTTKNAFT